MRLALAGTGSLAQDLLRAVQQTEDVEVTAIYHHSPDPEAAGKLAESYGIREIYDDYSRMVRLAKADFVYIALVNDAHFAYAKEALEHGLNVIVEKPMCPTAKEVKLLADLAWEKELFLFEAVTTLHTQNYRSLKDMVKQLGSIRMVLCNFSQRSSRYDRYWSGFVAPVFDPEHFGGALYDINVYNINFVVDLFGAPDDVGYYANLGYNGIDLSGTVVLQYPYFHAVCTGAKDSTSPGYLIVQGDKGYVKLDGDPNSAPKLEMNISGRSGVFRLNRYEHRMIHELLDFDQTWKQRNLTRAKYWLETSIAVADTIERAAASAGLMYGAQDEAFSQDESDMYPAGEAESETATAGETRLDLDEVREDAKEDAWEDTGEDTRDDAEEDIRDYAEENAKEDAWKEASGPAVKHDGGLQDRGYRGVRSREARYGDVGDRETGYRDVGPKDAAPREAGYSDDGSREAGYSDDGYRDAGYADDEPQDSDYQDIERLPLVDGYTDTDMDVDDGADDFMDIQDIQEYP